MKKKEDKPSGPTCQDCVFWVPEPESGNELGECFRNPPIAVIDSEEGIACVRPMTAKADRACGEFKAKQ